MSPLTLTYKIFASEANRPDPKLAIPIAGDDPEAVQTAPSIVMPGMLGATTKAKSNNLGRQIAKPQ
jgi:hypothetical protein